MDDLYEHAPCGYLSTLLDGTIVKVNQTFLDWTGHERAQLSGTRFPSLLTVGSRMLHETHISLLVTVEGSAREIAAEMVRADGTILLVLLNAARREVPTTRGSLSLIRYTVLDATERRRYEQDLLEARRRAETALETVRRLEELLPICAWCRRVRTKQGAWMQLDQYLSDVGVPVTHGICQECAERQ